MSLKTSVKFERNSLKRLKSWPGRICLVLTKGTSSPWYLASLDETMQGGLRRCLESEAFDKLLRGDSLSITMPVGLASSELQIIKVNENDPISNSRFVGGSIANSKERNPLLIICEPSTNIIEILYGFFLKAYQFDIHKSNRQTYVDKILIMNRDVKAVRSKFKSLKSLLEGVYFCRNLINEPANILNTLEFCERLESLTKFGLKVEILDEISLKKLKMQALLAVGQGSEYPSRVAVIHWRGAKKSQQPLLLLGKGVVFDSGGISLKSSGGMEEMVMDMGGAGVVAGTMKAIALRKAPVNVIGLLGLVENMPDGKAQRPGDVIKTMKGDTVEVINTDAEGRLVLADLLWYAQTRFSPKAIIDLATLTGAIIIALGHETAGIFSNDDKLCEKFLEAGKLEGEESWRLPLGSKYRKQLKSRVADIANVGGRAGSAIIAAQFLKNFVEDGTPWIHVDIAGVAFSKSASALSARGATGWGVATLHRFIKTHFENVSKGHE